MKNSIPFILLIFIPILLGGCTTPSNAYFRTGWNTTISCGGSQAYTAQVLADANSNLELKVYDIEYLSECFVVPTRSGYNIVALSCSRLTSVQMKEVLDLVKSILMAGLTTESTFDLDSEAEQGTGGNAF